jgi:hypothetical protein
MRNVQELHMSARLGGEFYYWEDIPVRRLFLTLVRSEHKIFAAPSTMPAQILDIVLRNPHLEDLFVTYFCASGCTTSCTDDENIKGWSKRPSAPYQPRIHYYRVWAMNPDDEKRTLGYHISLEQLSWREEHM